VPTPIVIRQGIVKLNYVAAPTVVDLSCYAVALELTGNTEEVDLGTFCAPGATDQGRTTYSAVLSLLWSPGLYALLAPHVGHEGVLAFAPVHTLPLEFVRFATRYSSQPWGRFEIGQRVEVDLPLAVLDTPTWED